MLRLLLLSSLLALATTSCVGIPPFRTCDAPSAVTLAALPAELSLVGLYRDPSLRTVRDDVLAYEPAFALWSDGADKKRWLALPAGTQIDTSNMDDWSFPIGTKLFKEFSQNGVRLETRVLIKRGRGALDWAAASYVWRADQSDARLAPEGAEDILGTQHDAPAAEKCGGCHAGRASYVLGFSAVQLANVDAADVTSLATLVSAGLLTHPPDAVHALTLPPIERAALGYMHANCGSCHNQQRPAQSGPRCYDPRRKIDLWLPYTHDDAAARAAIEATVVPDFVRAGEPDRGRLMRLVRRREGILLHMPPLASERRDEQGEATLRAWIAALERAHP